jgi:F1F0 ATPase subunit 2
MNDAVGLAAAVVAGATLGAVYLAMLWVSLQWFLRGRGASVLFLAGAVLRLALTVLGLYAVLQLGDWRHMVSALAGFVLVRVLATRAMQRRYTAPVDGGTWG